MRKDSEQNEQLAFELEAALQESGIDKVRRSRMMDTYYVHIHKDVDPEERPWWYELCVYVYSDRYDLKYMDIGMDNLQLGWPNDTNQLDGPATGVSVCLDFTIGKDVVVGETYRSDFNMNLIEVLQFVRWWKKL